MQTISRRALAFSILGMATVLCAGSLESRAQQPSVYGVPAVETKAAATPKLRLAPLASPTTSVRQIWTK